MITFKVSPERDDADDCPRLEVKETCWLLHGSAKASTLWRPVGGHLGNGRNVMLWTTKTKVAQPAGPAQPHSHLLVLAGGLSDMPSRKTLISAEVWRGREGR